MESKQLKHLDKNKKYIIATDLDGTFLGKYASGMNIDNYRAAKAIKESGNYFVLATGRSWWATKMIYEQLGLDTPLVLFSGAQVKTNYLIENKKDKVEIDGNEIDKEFIIEFIEKFQILEKIEDLVIIGHKYSAHFQKQNNINDLFFAPYEIVINLKPEFATEEYIEEIKNFVEENYTIRIWKNSQMNDNTDLVISLKGTNKAVGLKTIAKQLNIPQENVIYFGDNINDLEALEWAGYSIAPSNAILEAKQIADEVLEKSHGEGAVAEKILDLIYG